MHTATTSFNTLRSFVTPRLIGDLNTSHYWSSTISVSPWHAIAPASNRTWRNKSHQRGQIVQALARDCCQDRHHIWGAAERKFANTPSSDFFCGRGYLPTIKENFFCHFKSLFEQEQCMVSNWFIRASIVLRGCSSSLLTSCTSFDI